MKAVRLVSLVSAGAMHGIASGLQSPTVQHAASFRDAARRPRNTAKDFPAAAAASSTDTDEQPPPSYGLYDVQEEMLIKRGELEEELMAGRSSPLKANKPKGIGGQSKGFGAAGGGGGGSKSGFQREAKSHASVLGKEGVVRIDNVLSPQLADQMREYVLKLRQDSLDQVKAGTVKQTDRFADVLLRSNRCDLKIPLGDAMSDGSPTPVIAALHHLFCQSAVKQVIETIFTDGAVLYELSCLISDPGSQRQVMHPDNPMIPGREEPTLLTCFIALQVRVREMPTKSECRFQASMIHVSCF